MGTSRTEVRVERVEENGNRFYQGVVKGRKLKGTSVTTIIGKFEDKSWLERWWYNLGKEFANPNHSHEDILTIGKELASRVSNEASSHGTSQHEQAEFMLSKVEGYQTPSQTTLPDELAQFLHNEVTPYPHPGFPNGIGCEVPILYEKYNNVVGGTTDLVGEVKLDNLYFHDDKQRVSEVLNTDKILVVGDYKFPKKPKYDRDNIKYFLQLPAYGVGLKYTYDLDVNYGLLIISPRTNNKLYLWLFEKNVLDYYHRVFDEMLYLYSTDNCELFSWNSFADKALKEDGAKGRRLVYRR